MDQYNFIIIPSAVKELGTGHISRISSLIHHMKRYKSINIKILCFNDEQKKFIKSYIRVNNEIIVIDQSTIKDYMNDNAIDLCIIDDYNFDLSIIENARLGNAPVVIFDDFYHKDDYKNVFIINTLGNRHKDPKRYEKLNGRLFAGDLTHQVIREDLTSIPLVEKVNNKDINELLVLTGGNDVLNIRFDILDLLQTHIISAIPHVKITLILGTTEDRQKIEEMNNGKINILFRPDNIAELIAHSQWAITAGGQTTFELMFHKVPTFLYMIADNQENLVETLKDTYDFLCDCRLKGWQTEFVTNTLKYHKNLISTPSQKPIPTTTGGSALAELLYTYTVREKIRKIGVH